MKKLISLFSFSFFTFLFIFPTKTFAVETDGPYYFQNLQSSKCMYVDGSSLLNGAILEQLTCQNLAGERFYLNGPYSSGAASGWWRIINQHSGKCVEVPNNLTADGVTLKQATCV